MSETGLTFTIKTPEGHLTNVFTVHFEKNSLIALVFYCCLIWTNKNQLGKCFTKYTKLFEKYSWKIFFVKLFQLVFTCSTSTMETLELCIVDFKQINAWGSASQNTWNCSESFHGGILLVKSWPYRSSRPQLLCKKSVLRNFTKFTGKHLRQSLFF